MQPKDMLRNFATLALDKGRQFAKTHGRPLGDKLAEKLSKAGVDRGLLQEPLSLDDIIARLKALRDSGGISVEDFKKLKQQVRERFAKK